MSMGAPYYLRNKDWYTEDEHGRDKLTDKAPKKARDSFIACWGSDDPEKRSAFYFLSNEKWYVINKKVLKEGEGIPFYLTKKAPPEAEYSFIKYCENAGGDGDGRMYFMTNPDWYKIDENGEYVLTEKATPAAKASYFVIHPMVCF